MVSRILCLGRLRARDRVALPDPPTTSFVADRLSSPPLYTLGRGRLEVSLVIFNQGYVVTGATCIVARIIVYIITLQC